MRVERRICFRGYKIRGPHRMDLARDHRTEMRAQRHGKGRERLKILRVGR